MNESSLPGPGQDWKARLIAEWEESRRQNQREAAHQRRAEYERQSSYLVEALRKLGVPADPSAVVPDSRGDHAVMDVDGCVFLSGWDHGPAAHLQGTCPRCGVTTASDVVYSRSNLAQLLTEFLPAFHHCADLSRAPEPEAVRQDCTPVEARLLVALKEWLAEAG